MTWTLIDPLTAPKSRSFHVKGIQQDGVCHDHPRWSIWVENGGTHDEHGTLGGAIYIRNVATGAKIRIFGVNHWFWSNDSRTVVWPAATPETYTPDLWENVQKIVFPGATIEIIASPTRFEIAPKIGIARVGNSYEYYVGPEAPDTPYTGPFRDEKLRLLKQGARFRVYEVDADGNAVGEVKASANTHIKWTVHLANKKASFKKFRGRFVETENLRNPTIQGNLQPDQRSELIIDVGPRTIEGVNQGGDLKTPQVSFSPVRLFDQELEGVSIGSLRTDENGNLIVLGGNGKSDRVKSYKGTKLPIHLITNYVNNDWWFDDTSDGTVDAVVVIDGVEHKVEPAWVSVAPPKFAPTVKNVVTLYHVVEEASGAFKLPEKVHYYRDIASIFESPALCGYLNRWANLGHGPNSNAHFLSKAWQDKLKDNSPENAEFRLNLFGRFRAPSDELKKVEQFSDASYGEATLYFMPALSGDNGDFDEGDPSTWLSVSTGSYEILKKWRDGQFIVEENRPIYNKIEDVPLAERPKALTKAALEWCVGGPFFPGIEMTYTSRFPETYSAPFTIDRSKTKPGDLTRFMAMPWQADFFECQDHWWPAARPDAVIAFDDYQISTFSGDPHDDIGRRLSNKRTKWTRGFRENQGSDSNPNHVHWGNMDMARHWDMLGFIVPLPAERPYSNIAGRAEEKDYDWRTDLQKKKWDFRKDPFVLVELERRPTFLIDALPSKKDLYTIKNFVIHLRWAMQLELTTIPAYLSAMYALKDSEIAQIARDDTLTPLTVYQQRASRARKLIKSVAIEEMLHLCLVANVISALGATPRFYDVRLVPEYPTVIPHAAASDTMIYLNPPTKQTLSIFRLIETPAEKSAPAEGSSFKTIGQFYDFLRHTVKELGQDVFKGNPNLQLGAGQGYFPSVMGSGGLVTVTSVQSALDAFEIIREQGEGSEDLDEGGKIRIAEQNHYYKFTEVWEDCDFGDQMINASGDVTNTASLPDDHPITKANVAFNVSYCYLLKVLDNLYQVEDPAEKHARIRSGMFIAMDQLMRPLANLMVTQPLPGYPGVFAAPTFSFFDFSLNPGTPKEQLIERVTAAADAFPDLLNRNVVENAKRIINVP